MLAAFLAFVMGLFKDWITKPPAVVPIAEGLGEATQKVADVQKQADTQAAIAKAEAQAPATVAAVVATLNEGKF
jgi:regulator of protease activity HflC (stomatin/prohibitin superfamily)